MIYNNVYVYVYIYNLFSTPNKALNYLSLCHSLYLSPYSYETQTNLALHTCAVGHFHTWEFLPSLHYLLPPYNVTGTIQCNSGRLATIFSGTAECPGLCSNHNFLKHHLPISHSTFRCLLFCFCLDSFFFANENIWLQNFLFINPDRLMSFW